MLRKKTLLPLLLCCLFTFSAVAADSYTPSNIHENVDIDIFENNVRFSMSTSYLQGVIATIQTVQNYGIIDSAVCIPKGKNTIGNTQDAIRALNPAPFDNDNNGGVVYIFSAMAVKFPC